MTPEQYLTVARQCGATVYTNRHYPLQPAVSFGHAAWLKFCERLEKPAPNTLSVVTDDPCPGCKPGTACRTPSCGRLSKISLAKAIEIKKPNGELYMTVWLESGQLKMQLMGSWPHPVIHLDERVIPQLRDALNALNTLTENDRARDENNSVAIDRACFDRGCACFDPRIDKNAVIVEKRS